MESETIPVRTEDGGVIDAVVLRKSADSIQIVLGKGTHSVKCELTPTRNGLAYAGSVMGREVIYEQSRDTVEQAINATRHDPNAPHRRRR